MQIKNIVAAVDASSEGMWAAVTAWKLAEASEANCRFIHATFDLNTLSPTPPGLNFDEYVERIANGARDELKEKMRGEVPEQALDALEIRIGNAPFVVGQAAAESNADLIVLGGRRRSPALRWLEGSILKHLMRAGDAPVLAAVPPTFQYQRVLIAVDRSSMMEPTIRWGRHLAEIHGATVRLFHAVAPLPYDYAAAIYQPDEYLGWSRTEFEEQLGRIKDAEGMTWDVVHGPVARSISHEVRRWNADLLVLGSHGKGFVDRVLLGSTTTRLANELPTSLLVVPATADMMKAELQNKMEEANT